MKYSSVARYNFAAVLVFILILNLTHCLSSVGEQTADLHVIEEPEESEEPTMPVNAVFSVEPCPSDFVRINDICVLVD